MEIRIVKPNKSTPHYQLQFNGLEINKDSSMSTTSKMIMITVGMSKKQLFGLRNELNKMNFNKIGGKTWKTK